jgi:hypothetical protein
VDRIERRHILRYSFVTRQNNLKENMPLNKSIRFTQNGTEEALSLIAQIVKNGAQKMLQAAIEAEVEQFIHKHNQLYDEDGHRIVVRNGYKDRRGIPPELEYFKVRQPSSPFTPSRHSMRNI